MSRNGERRPRPQCSGPLPAGYRHGERRTYLGGYCRARACADAALDYAAERYRARRGGDLQRPRVLSEVEVEARRHICRACGAGVGDPCTTGKGTRAHRSHLPRRDPAAPVRYDVRRDRRNARRKRPSAATGAGSSALATPTAPGDDERV